jgi:hypothetical protein
MANIAHFHQPSPPYQGFGLRPIQGTFASHGKVLLISLLGLRGSSHIEPMRDHRWGMRRPRHLFLPNSPPRF